MQSEREIAFCYLALAKCKKWTKAKCRKAISEQLRLYPYWLKDRLDVIPKVYAQQKEMHENGTHKCEERIVSLQQPHVRPINRGKRPNPTEFGQKLHLSVVDGFTYLEKTSWNSFNEGKELIDVAEDYRRKFGCYPEAILADRIYQTRENRAFCKAHDIRLSGPPLGRRKADSTDEKIQGQLYRDACERNAVEGRNGNAKRRWGLDLIMSKLEETAKTEAALSIIAMNVAHCLALWLLRFFAFNRFVTKEADIRLRIDYNEFIHASEEERLNIYNNHIVQSIRTLQKKLGPDFDYSKLEEDVKQALCMRENNCDQRNWEEEEGQL